MSLMVFASTMGEGSRALSQHNPSVVKVESASTPVTPSSVPNEIRKPAQSVSPKNLIA